MPLDFAARNAIRSGVPERDPADALERVTRYVAERSAETPKQLELRGIPSGGARSRTADLGIMRPSL